MEEKKIMCETCLYNKNCQFLKKHRNAIVEGCTAYKDARNTVEVVRCKDCRHSRPIDNTKSPEKYFKDECVVCQCEDVVGDDDMIYIPTHYCSYGARKEI